MRQKTIDFFTKGHHRTLLAKKNIFYSLLIKFSTMLITFTIISLSIKYLGKETYGVWVILSGLVVWTDFFDFGFTHGLRNMLAESIAKGESDKGKSYISTTFAVMFIISILLAIIFIPIIEIIDWNTLLKINFISIVEVKILLYIVLGSFLLKIIYKPITAVLNAVQWPSIVQLISLVGAFLSLTALFYLLNTSENDSSLLIYVITQSIAPLIILIIASFYLFQFKFHTLKPSIRDINFSYFKKIASLGSGFFILQFSGLIIYQTDNIIISNLFGPSSVTDYNIVLRYFSILSIAMGIIMSPFWTAFTDAYAKNEFKWIKNTVHKLIKIMIFFILIAIFFILLSDHVYKIWINDTIQIPHLITIMMAISVILTGFFSVFIYVINGIGKIQLSIYTNLFMALLNIPLSFLFADTFAMGIPGILFATIICITFPGIITIIQYHKIINSNATGIWNK